MLMLVLSAGGLAGIERVIQYEANRRYQQEQQNNSYTANNGSNSTSKENYNNGTNNANEPFVLFTPEEYERLVREREQTLRRRT